MGNVALENKYPFWRVLSSEGQNYLSPEIEYYVDPSYEPYHNDMKHYDLDSLS